MSAVAERPDTATPVRARDRVIGWQRRFPALQLGALVAVSVYGVIALPGLGSAQGIKTILVIAAIIGLAAVGQTLVILLGGFDLSIPGFMVASAYMVTTIREQYHLSFFVALVIALVVCSALGALSGRICCVYRVQPLIVTLGMGTAAAGLAQVVSKSPSVGSAPAWAVSLTSVRTTTFGLGVPPLVPIWIGVAVLVTVVIHRTTFGRRLMATGANERAAEYSLIKVRRVWSMTFAISAAISVLVGLLVAGFAGTLDSTAAQPYLFQTLVAVIIGGTIFGGPGDYLRTVIGALFLAVVNSVLVGSGGTAPDQDILYGLVLATAVTVYGRERRLREEI
ncbi:MAG TPA: ABC transporter permease [Baekduia sp.]